MGGVVVGVVLAAVVLSACGGGAATQASAEPVEDRATQGEPAPTEEASAEPTVEPTAEPTAEQTAEPVAPLPSASDAILEVLLTRASDAKVVAATLYQLMSIPVPGGESVVFHFEDALGAVNIGCTGHALLQLAEDGAAYEVAGISASCGQVEVVEPVTVFDSLGIDENGDGAQVIFGEIYDEAVVAIRVFYAGGQTNAVISGGGYQALLPLDAAEIKVIAYDADGNTLLEGAPGQE
jgi:cell division septation protein DedD